MQCLYGLQPSLTWQKIWMHCMVLTINSFLTPLSFLPSYLDFNFIMHCLSLSFPLCLFSPHPFTVSSSESHTEPPTLAFYFLSCSSSINVTEYLMQIQKCVDWTGHKFISDGKDITTKLWEIFEAACCAVWRA